MLERLRRCDLREMADSCGGAAAGPPQVVEVRRELLEACMTCPLCNKLLEEATTISECLHTFCRRCIFEKLTDEEVECCPICNIDLGCVPVEKLRSDHSLQELRAKIFPLKRRKVEAPDIAPSITLPVRRKERSLSSLVVNTPRVARKRGLTGRRTRAVARKASALRRLSPIVAEEEIDEGQSSPENVSKISHNRRQVKNSSNAESSNKTANKDAENHRQSIQDKTELWKPLNCLVEAANRTRTPKGGSLSPSTRINQSNGTASEVNMHNSMVREQSYKSKIQDDKNGDVTLSPKKVKARRLNAISRRKEELRSAAQAIIDSAIGKREREKIPIWLSLVASFDEKVDSPLPQIDVSYLRIKDGNLPVSFIQKYLVKKLDLATEAEVEIKCRQQPVSPTLAIYKLVEMWLQQGPPLMQASDKVQITIGAPAKDFVTMLTYNRKAPAP